MPRYSTPVDICNRALQLCRRERIVGFSDQSQAARETAFAYDKLRQAELERNLWTFATKKAVLRPVDTVTAVLATSAQTLSGTTLSFTDTTGVVVGQLVTGTNIAAGSTVVSFVEDTSVLLSLAVLVGTVALGEAITFGPLTFTWTPPAYVAATNYLVGQVVVDTYGEWWQSKVGTTVGPNVGNTPDVGAFWARYSGPDTLQTWNTDTSYFPGELALASTGAVYMSLIASAGNAGHNPVTTTGFWRIVNGTATGLSVLYPIGSGPWSDLRTSNVFRLPSGYLRKAPTDPKSGAGGMGWPGVDAWPYDRWYEDWLVEGEYIVSGQRQPILMRYVADFVDVPAMPAAFCEMLAARITEECATVLAPADALQIVLANAARHYSRARRAAAGVNAMELGPVVQMDSYITARA